MNTSTGFRLLLKPQPLAGLALMSLGVGTLSSAVIRVALSTVGCAALAGPIPTWGFPTVVIWGMGLFSIGFWTMSNAFR